MIMKGCRVLLVDDDPAVLSVLEWALQDLGCRTTIALGGRAALAGLFSESFDVMITDLIMPDLDGARLIEKARTLDASMKIIVMTGNPELLPSIRCAGAGIDGSMIKPFGINTLKKALWNCAGAEDRPAALLGNGV